MHTEYFTSNKKRFQDFNEYSAEKTVFFEIWNKKNGIRDVNFEKYGKISKFSLKQCWFYSAFYNLRQVHSQSWLLKSIRIVFKYYLNPVSNIPSAWKTAPLEIKISWIQLQFTELMKTVLC